MNAKTKPVTVKQAASVAAIARYAGVSTATVDRVLHDRPNVRPATRQRVLQARAAIESGALDSNRQRPWRLKVILPLHAGRSTEFFARCIQELGGDGDATIECDFAAKMEPVQLARKLRACLSLSLIHI